MITIQSQNGYYPDNQKHAYQKRLRQRFQLKRVLARIFIEHDYGFMIFKTELAKSKLKIPITKALYKHLSQAMVYKVVRAAETVQIVQGNPSLQRFSLRTIKYTYFLVKNCRRFFSEEDNKTIFKLCKQQYQLGQEIITVEQVQHFYKELVDLVQSRASRHHQKPQETVMDFLAEQENRKKISYLSTIWNQQYQLFLMETYPKHQNFSQIKQAFQKQFPKEAESFTSQSLGHQFYKIMKQIIRKIEKSCKKIKDPNFPKMIKLLGKTIRRLVIPEEAEDIRNMVVRLYRKTSINKQELHEAVDLINQYIRQKQISEREEINSIEPKKRTQIKQKLQTTPTSINQTSLLTNTLFCDRKGMQILSILLDNPHKTNSNQMLTLSNRTSILIQTDSFQGGYPSSLQNYCNFSEKQIEKLMGTNPFTSQESRDDTKINDNE